MLVRTSPPPETGPEAEAQAEAEAAAAETAADSATGAAAGPAVDASDTAAAGTGTGPAADGRFQAVVAGTGSAVVAGTESAGAEIPAGTEASAGKEVRRLEQVVIRFAGDSGDGMQLTGDRFTSETASFGNDLSTLPNFPAEIRAPAGTLPGVSSFQLHFADHDILTPGDAPDVLVAMNPAALKANLADVPRGAQIIVNTDEFTPRALTRAGYRTDPLDDGSLAGHNVHPVPLGTLTVEALKEFGLSRKDADRSKNMFALGLLSWMYHRPTQGTEAFLRTKFARRPHIAEANIAAFRAGWNFGETTEDFAVSYEVAPATKAFPPGTYRSVSGNLALSYGLVAAARQAELPLFLGSYPITPASDILHELSRHKNFGVRTFQAEDEIAGIGAALGAAFGGSLGVTTTSGPGVALKSEAIGLAVSLELPLLVVDIQRGGPSTGLPTKTEQADLLQAMFGRYGEAPVPVIAPATPSDCFTAALDAARIALTYRTPVLLLSDGYLANGTEPWRIPQTGELPDLRVRFASGPNHTLDDGTEVFWPYKRDPRTLARPWAIPGTPGLEHRIGGIEKADGSGDISYDPANHDLMVRTRQAKIDGIDVPDLEADDPGAADGDGARLLVLAWGSTYGPVTAAVRRVRAAGHKIAQAHLRHINPFPANLGELLTAYDQVIVPEMNLGQLALLIRARYLVDARSHTQVNGMPFKAEELAHAFEEAIRHA
ncbi:2-oxoacid:acceptor oxidoreductase subunit alpha [Streptomyces asoensis]|uniref:2-oxoacid:acceptor oxidoreductase subunit alpha n=1 Tax=Streptomyces asoensis TaxID=249586 RepID=UPI003400ED16